MGEMSTKYKVSRKTTSRIWSQVKQQQQQNSFPINVNSKRVGKKSRGQIIFDDTKFKSLEKAKKKSSCCCQNNGCESKHTMEMEEKEGHKKAHQCNQTTAK